MHRTSTPSRTRRSRHLRRTAAAVALSAAAVAGAGTANAVGSPAQVSDDGRIIGFCHVMSYGAWLATACPPGAEPYMGEVPFRVISGRNRAETAAAIREAAPSFVAHTVFIANANGVDAAAVQPYATGPIVLVPSGDALPATTRQRLASLDPAAVVVIGGPGAVSPTMRIEVARAVNS